MLEQLFAHLQPLARVSSRTQEWRDKTIDTATRRMEVQRIDSMDGDVQFVHQTPAELQLLFNELLIGVTRFFRDAAAFAELQEQVIAQLFPSGPQDGRCMYGWQVVVPGRRPTRWQCC